MKEAQLELCTMCSPKKDDNVNPTVPSESNLKLLPVINGLFAALDHHNIDHHPAAVDFFYRLKMHSAAYNS